MRTAIDKFESLQDEVDRVDHKVQQLDEFSSANWAQVLDSAGLTESSLKELMNSTAQLSAEKAKQQPKKLVFASFS